MGVTVLRVAGASANVRNVRFVLHGQVALAAAQSEKEELCEILFAAFDASSTRDANSKKRKNFRGKDLDDDENELVKSTHRRQIRTRDAKTFFCAREET